jgi:hypothetical protein
MSVTSSPDDYLYFMGRGGEIDSQRLLYGDRLRLRYPGEAAPDHGPIDKSIVVAELDHIPVSLNQIWEAGGNNVIYWLDTEEQRLHLKNSGNERTLRLPLTAKRIRSIAPTVGFFKLAWEGKSQEGKARLCFGFSEGDEVVQAGSASGDFSHLSFSQGDFYGLDQTCENTLFWRTGSGYGSARFHNVDVDPKMCLRDGQKNRFLLVGNGAERIGGYPSRRDFVENYHLSVIEFSPSSLGEFTSTQDLEIGKKAPIDAAISSNTQGTMISISYIDHQHQLQIGADWEGVRATVDRKAVPLEMSDNGSWMSSDENGNTYVVWAHEAGGGREIRAARVPDKGQDLEPVTLAVTEALPREVSLCSGRHGLHLAWLEDDNSGSSKRLRSSSWRPDGEVSENDLDVASQSSEGLSIASFSPDYLGNPTLLWSREQEGDGQPARAEIKSLSFD